MVLLDTCHKEEKEIKIYGMQRFLPHAIKKIYEPIFGPASE
ncbi:MAG: hypothetical protein PHS10_06985 [Thiovulaceae bacterium]|nr:hypothetical protein [Sulfurimonadaceae bacterium]